MKTKRAFIFWATLFYLLLSAMPSWAYYNSSAGRWLSRDPILEGGGLNLHEFVFNNPIQKIDGLGDTAIETGDGYSLRLDPHNTGGSAQLEVHVKYKGNEVGIFTKDGYINKHGISGALSDANIPDHIKNKVNGMAVDFERRAGRIGEKGTQNIKNGSWRSGGGAHLKLGAGLMVVGAIMMASQGSAHAEALANSTMEYLRFKQSGDQGFADLAAIETALNVQNITQDGFLMYTVLGALLE